MINEKCLFPLVKTVTKENQISWGLKRETQLRMSKTSDP